MLAKRPCNRKPFRNESEAIKAVNAASYAAKVYACKPCKAFHIMPQYVRKKPIMVYEAPRRDIQHSAALKCNACNHAWAVRYDAVLQRALSDAVAKNSTCPECKSAEVLHIHSV